MNLLASFRMSFLAIVVKVLGGLVLNKLLAVYTGSFGIALVGQFQNFIQLTTTISNAGMVEGTVKYISERQDRYRELLIINVVIICIVIMSFVMTLFCFVLNEKISLYLFNSLVYAKVIQWYGLTILFFALNTVFLAIINAKNNIKLYYLLNISNNILFIFISTILIIKAHVLGALYSFLISQVIFFLINMFFIIKHEYVIINFNFLKNNTYFFKLIKYSTMTLISIISISISQIIIRNYIGDNMSWEEAGYWQGILYISNVYLMIITMTTAVYLIPKLSSLTIKHELIHEISNSYKIILPIAILLSLLIYFLKYYIIIIIFSSKFLPMLYLFKWQLIGNVFKISGWILREFMWAKELTKEFIYTEIFYYVSLVIVSIIMIDNFNLIGAIYAFCIVNIVYFLIVISIYKNFIKNYK